MGQIERKMYKSSTRLGFMLLNTNIIKFKNLEVKGK